jgi:hypothetical protein
VVPERHRQRRGAQEGKEGHMRCIGRRRAET